MGWFADAVQNMNWAWIWFFIFGVGVVVWVLVFTVMVMSRLDSILRTLDRALIRNPEKPAKR